ncbi:MAG: hypothetical protein AVDCRST_MAG93-7651 [uncultured Chloroflexia bacterium]|uniref:Uncharacterized protein n=1 Tax=uncultured Chloroflexia bacterium TaxID=1672391 RepID=A0A6J4MJ07_9CHLR|nr:MAG: hypothetical protein AVDCRST_MAG93-7651 [uncultured Chloroflexia bacterium]
MDHRLRLRRELPAVASPDTTNEDLGEDELPCLEQVIQNVGMVAQCSAP